MTGWVRTGWLLAMLLWASGAAAGSRIVAVGDLHGDLAAWRAIARDAQLVDARGHWAGGATVLVQLGDAVDRGPDSLAVVDDLMRLQQEARHAGGRVVALVGNHEAMNVTDDLRYVTPADYAAFVDRDSTQRRDRAFAAHEVAIDRAYRQRDPTLTDSAIRDAWLAATPLGLVEHQTAWHPGGRIGRWVAGNPAVALIDGTIFVHGGIGPAYATVPIAEINARVAVALAAADTSPAAIINDPAGPLWYRGLAIADPAAAPVGEQLDRLLAAAHAQRIVIGHTPVLTGIAIRDDGRLIRIDTGISRVFKGTLSWLEINDGVPVAHRVDRPAAEGQ